MTSEAVIVRLPLVEEGPVPKLARVTSNPLIVNVVKGSVPPTVPPIVTFPVPALKVKFLPVAFALSVPVMEILPAPAPVERVMLFAVVRVTLPVRVISLLDVVMLPPRLIAPVIATVVLVVIAADWRIEAAVAERQLRAVVFPRAPENWMAPVPVVRVKQNGPLTVLEKIIFPLPAPVFIVTSCVRVIGSVQLMLSFVVVRLAPKETAPPPLSENAPSKEREAVLGIVKDPVWTIESGARLPVAVDKVLSNWNWVPVRVIPTGPVDKTAPVKWVRPLPADWVISTAVTEEKVALLALAINKPSREVTLPKAPQRIDPAPAVKVRSKVPSTVLRVKAPPPLFREVSAERMTGEPNWSEPVVDTFEPRVTAPPPLWTNVLLDVMVPAIVADPELTIAIGPLFVVVKELFKESVAVLKLIPPMAVVEIGPETVVKPVTVEE